MGSFMMKTSVVLRFWFILLFMTLLAVVFSLDASASFNVTAPNDGTNHSGRDGYMFINISYTNGSTDIIGPTNITVLANQSGSWVELGNLSSNLTITTTGIWGSLNISNWSGAVENVSLAINVTVRNETTTLSIGDAVNMSTIITIDSTPPSVYSSNISHPAKGTNYSNSGIGILLLNVTLLDVTAGVNVMFFNVTNSSGQQNATYTASNPAGNSWNATLNTAHFPDDSYNITVWANDTVSGSNLNRTSLVTEIYFDNTAPVMTFTCTPNPVTQDATLTCTCSAVGGTAGVNTTYATSGYDFTVNPSTSSTGTYTTSCNTKDLAENTNSKNFEYTVEGSGGGVTNSGGGSGSSGSDSEPSVSLSPDSSGEWAATFDFDSDELSEIGSVSQKLKKSERVTFMVSGKVHHVGVISLTESSAVLEVGGTEQAEFNVGDSKKFDVDEDNAFYDLKVVLGSISEDSADVDISYIHEAIPSSVGSEPSGEESGSSTLWWIIIFIVVLVVVVVVVLWMKNREK